MHWRLSFKEWETDRGRNNERALRHRASSDPSPGLVGYVDGQPVGWVAIGARSEYPRMQRSSVTRAHDEVSSWVISCVFVTRAWRGYGLQLDLIKAACDYAAGKGQGVVDAFPVDPEPGKVAGDNAMTGIAATFRRAGFVELARRRPDRPIMRREVL
jgi:GNAT superfamily N-acetyltransferase